MRVIFAHGKEGSPAGKKATYLREHFDAITPNLSGLTLPEQEEVLVNLIKENEDCLLIGSSMGGASATLASRRVKPKKLFLLAPALNYEECLEGIPLGIETVLLHGTNDDIIPYDVSVRASRLSGAKLIPVDDNHRLSSSEGIIIDTVKQLLGVD